jgi:hypothetical protein
MKAKRFCCLYSLIFMILTNEIPLLGNAGLTLTNETISKEIIDETAVNPTTILDMDFTTDLPSHMPTNSEYFEFYTWDKPSIKRLITITVDPLQNDEANAFIDHLRFPALDSGSSTIFQDLSCGVRLIHADQKGWRVDMKDGTSFKMKGYHIKMVYYIPRNIELHLKSNLSKISLGDLTGKVVLDLRSAKLKASHVNEMNLKATNSTVQISKVNLAMIQANHCEILLDKIQSATILKSSFSEYELNESGKLDIVDSKEDQFNVQTLNEINCTKSLFSNFHIIRLKQKLAIRGENGDVQIDEVSPDFSDIFITNSFSIIKIGSAINSAMQIDTRTQLTNFILDDQIKTLSKNEEQSYMIGKFSKGSPGDSKKVCIECKECEIEIR